jgi:hypothetical protein
MAGAEAFCMKDLIKRNSVLLVFVLAAVIACGSSVNQANFDKIETGMTQKEVDEILGPPTETSEVGFAGISGTTSKWQHNDSAIVINFLNGKVMAKQFLKGKQKPLQTKQDSE